MHDRLSGSTEVVTGPEEPVDADGQPVIIASEAAEQLREEACKLLEQVQRDDRLSQWQAAVMTGDLLDRARRSLAGADLPPTTFARILRSCVLVRDRATVPDLPPDSLLDELVIHTTEHGLASHNAAAQALRGMLADARGDLDEAMDAVVNAMVTVELDSQPSLERVFASNDIGSLLTHLGLVDIAVEQFDMAALDCAAAGLLREQIIVLGNKTISAIAHGLSLERASQWDQAAEQLADAAEYAKQATQLHEQADPKPPRLRPDHFVGFYSALAVADPTGEAAAELEPQLRSDLGSGDPDCRVTAALALARRLIATDRADQARDLLKQLPDWPRYSDAQPQLRMAVARTTAEVASEPKPEPGAAGMPGYLAVLETELWSRREVRARELRARLDRERLRRQHGPIRTLVAEDPLTGLPNRRVLDELLAERAAAARPGAAAMVDLDALRVVNYRGSHGDGDAALRAVAVAIRGSLREGDSVIRYGGDEFVLLLPSDDLDTATSKVERVVAAIASLPADRGFGVTASAGAIVVRPEESADSILVRADNAMAEAKQAGGNQVRTG